MSAEGEEATTAGAADFDDFKMYLSHFIVFAVCMAYVAPIFRNLLDDKPIKWGSKLRTGWNYISGGGGKVIKIKGSQ